MKSTFRWTNTTKSFRFLEPNKDVEIGKSVELEKLLHHIPGTISRNGTKVCFWGTLDPPKSWLPPLTLPVLRQSKKNSGLPGKRSFMTSSLDFPSKFRGPKSVPGRCSRAVTAPFLSVSGHDLSSPQEDLVAELLPWNLEGGKNPQGPSNPAPCILTGKVFYKVQRGLNSESAGLGWTGLGWTLSELCGRAVGLELESYPGRLRMPFAILSDQIHEPLAAFI